MYLITVKQPGKIAFKYLVKAVNLTDAETIIADELKDEFSITGMSAKVYDAIVNINEGGEHFIELVWESESADGKTIKYKELVIFDDEKSALIYCSDASKYHLELTKFNKLDILEILKKEE